MPETKVVLTEKDLPTHWYNIQADLPSPLPPVIHPGTRQPIGPADLAPLFPMELIKQEMTQERWVEIPEPVRDIYRLWRPSPLYRAHRLERALQTPARIYYKWEGVSPAGSHKPKWRPGEAGWCPAPAPRPGRAGPSWRRIPLPPAAWASPRTSCRARRRGCASSPWSPWPARA